MWKFRLKYALMLQECHFEQNFEVWVPYIHLCRSYLSIKENTTLAKTILLCLFHSTNCPTAYTLLPVYFFTITTKLSQLGHGPGAPCDYLVITLFLQILIFVLMHQLSFAFSNLKAINYNASIIQATSFYWNPPQCVYFNVERQSSRLKMQTIWSTFV